MFASFCEPGQHHHRERATARAGPKENRTADVPPCRQRKDERHARSQQAGRHHHLHRIPSTPPLLRVVPDGPRPKIHAPVSWKGEKLLGTDRIRVKVGENISGWVADKVPSRINDVSQEPRYSEIHPAIASMLSVPLISENRVLGVISATSEKKAAFSSTTWLMDDAGGPCRGADQQCPPLRSDERGAQRRRRRSENSPSGIIAVDQQKKITTFNRRAEEITKPSNT